ncbi:MAG: hypothetical protein AAB354_17295 [candidate division KSB1 bacterium]
MLTTILIDENGEGRITAADLKMLGLAPKSCVEAEITVKKSETPFPLEIPQDKTLQDILYEYEAKHAMTSEECSRKLEGDEIEETADLLRWMGFYELARRARARGDNPMEMKFTLKARVSQKRRGDHVEQLR